MQPALPGVHAKHIRRGQSLGLLLLVGFAWTALQILLQPSQVDSLMGVRCSSCFTEMSFQVAMQDSPKRFLHALTSTTDSNAAYLAARAAFQSSEDLPDFLLKCLEEICIINDPPSTLPRFIVGQLAAFLDKNGQPSMFEKTESTESEILDLALRLWRQPVAKASAARLLNIWQVRGRHITTDAWQMNFEVPRKEASPCISLIPTHDDTAMFQTRDLDTARPKKYNRRTGSWCSLPTCDTRGTAAR